MVNLKKKQNTMNTEHRNAFKYHTEPVQLEKSLGAWLVDDVLREYLIWLLYSCDEGQEKTEKWCAYVRLTSQAFSQTEVALRIEHTVETWAV